MSGPCTDCGGPDYQTLEARIAELEAENAGWKRSHTVWCDDLANIENLKQRAERADAELAKFKSRHTGGGCGMGVMVGGWAP